MGERAMNAASLLVASGLDATVLDPRVIRPVDPAMLDRIATAKLVVTAEDGMIHGGAGQFLRSEIEAAADARGMTPPRVVNLGVPTTFVAHGSVDAILARLGLDAEGIAASVLAAKSRLAGQASPPQQGSSKGLAEEFSLRASERSVVKR
jgi:1-deoxy-D-xylulose-5-phosphate synthase